MKLKENYKLLVNLKKKLQQESLPYGHIIYIYIPVYLYLTTSDNGQEWVFIRAVRFHQIIIIIDN